MPNLKDIRTRIGSVKNTRKITKAMKMVAAAKLRRAQEAMQAARPYAVKMKEVIEGLADRVDEDAHPLLESRPEREKILVVVVSSNRGLCGGFNTNLFRAVDRFLKEQQLAGEVIEVASVGRKAREHYNRSGFEIVRSYDDVIGDVNFKKAKKIAGELIADFVEKRYDAVYVCYNKFISAIVAEKMIVPLLPLSVEGAEEAAEAREDRKKNTSAGDFIYEPDVNTLLGQLLPGNVEVQVLQALLESEASEHAARMTAMDSATNNAGDMIDNLTLQYNRARQAYITKEIVEIVSGAESLKG